LNLKPLFTCMRQDFSVIPLESWRSCAIKVSNEPDLLVNLG
jgi:hypothetical protein